MWTVCTILLMLITSGSWAEKARFDNYVVYRLIPTTKNHLDVLRVLEEEPDGLNFWKSVGSMNSSVDVMVPPHKRADFHDALRDLDLEKEVFIQDVQHLIDSERPSDDPRTDFNWNSYHRIDEIYSWLNSLSLTNPGIVTPIVAGTTYEGRQIRGVKISYKSNNPGVFIEAGMHAREWIGPATATYILNELLTSNDPNIRYIAQNFDWYIVPSANPDGYEYTHTTNRLWRKTRSGGYVCRGVDPNRNFGFHWMEGGASSNSCLETHAGQSAFSEVETRSMAWYIWSISRKIQVYIAFHSYSQLLLIPYGIDSERVSNYQQLLKIGHKMTASLARRYGTRYTVGNIVDILYVVSGSSMDWVKGSIGVPFTYTYELRDQGRYGFLLPANHIIPTGQETLDSIVTLLQETRLSP